MSSQADVRSGKTRSRDCSLGGRGTSRKVALFRYGYEYAYISEMARRTREVTCMKACNSMVDRIKT